MSSDIVIKWSPRTAPQTQQKQQTRAVEMVEKALREGRKDSIRLFAPRRWGKSEVMRRIAQNMASSYTRILIATASTHVFHTNWADLRETVSWVTHLRVGECKPVTASDKVLVLIDDIDRISDADLDVCRDIVTGLGAQCVVTSSPTEQTRIKG